MVETTVVNKDSSAAYCSLKPGKNLCESRGIGNHSISSNAVDFTCRRRDKGKGANKGIHKDMARSIQDRYLAYLGIFV